MSIETLNQLDVDFSASHAYVYYGRGNVKNAWNFRQVYPHVARYLEYGEPIPEDYSDGTPSFQPIHMLPWTWSGFLIYHHPDTEAWK